MVLGGLFLLWQWWRPLEVAAMHDEADDRPRTSP
jgi:hypothetical protein